MLKLGNFPVVFMNTGVRDAGQGHLRHWREGSRAPLPRWPSGDSLLPLYFSPSHAFTWGLGTWFTLPHDPSRRGASAPRLASLSSVSTLHTRIINIQQFKKKTFFCLHSLLSVPSLPKSRDTNLVFLISEPFLNMVEDVWLQEVKYFHLSEGGK